MFIRTFYILLVIKLLFLWTCECQNQLDLRLLANNSCQNNRWNCTNGQTIPCSEVCDGHKNCVDSSDETNLACRNVFCSDDQFRCAYGACISSNFECNGIQDCADNSDEMSLNCPGVLDTLTRNKNCSVGSFQCADGTCILEERVCDGKQDCPLINSDETEELCSNHYCPEDSFRCRYGACILSFFLCNGVKDCADGSDEHTNCPNYVPSIGGTENNRNVYIDGNSGANGVTGWGVPETQGVGLTRPDIGKSSIPEPPPALSNFIPDSNENDLLHFYKALVSRILIDLNKIEQSILNSIHSEEQYKNVEQDRPQLPELPDLPSLPPLPPEPFYSQNPFKSSSPSLQPNENKNPSTNSGPKVSQVGSVRTFSSPRLNSARANYGAGDCALEDVDGLEYFNEDNFQILGNSVPNGSKITYACINLEQRLSNDKPNTCSNGKFVNETPKCAAYCLSVSLNSISVQASCRSRDGQKIPCSGLLPVGSVAILTCKVGYKLPDIVVKDAVTCLDNGEWDSPLFKCQQICGIIQDAEATIVGGFKTNITQVPWHVAIYEARMNTVEQICGGTIINPTAVVTAAHCFWNGQKQEIYPARRFRVIVGKTLRKYSIREPLTQMIKIKTIDTYDQYRDYNGLFVADIAVLVLKKPIIFAPHIKPICIEYSLKNNERYVASGLKGRVAGWGLTSSGGQPSEDLKVIDMPTVDYNTCIKVSPPDFQPFVTSDKFCGGFTTGESVCVGDSGGAMALAKPVGRNQVYYLRGIVSTGPRLGTSCDNNKYSAFTDVQLNIVFLYKYISTTA